MELILISLLLCILGLNIHKTIVFVFIIAELLNCTRVVWIINLFCDNRSLLIVKQFILNF